MKVMPKPDAKSVVHGWLKSGQIVTVLGVRSNSRGSDYHIWSDLQKSAVLFSVSEFEIIDPTLSKRWVAEIDLNGFIDLTPSAWMEKGFWDRYNDGESNADRVFMEEMAALINE